MALEINEIGIRVRVYDDARCGEDCSAEDGEDDRDREREDMVEDCVRRVLQTLRDLGER